MIPVPTISFSPGRGTRMETTPGRVLATASVTGLRRSKATFLGSFAETREVKTRAATRAAQHDALSLMGSSFRQPGDLSIEAHGFASPPHDGFAVSGM